MKSYKEMKRSELTKIANPLVSKLNKRIRRMEQAGRLSQAYYELENARGTKPRFSVAMKTKEEIIAEIKAMKHYEQLQTSTLREQRKVERKIEKSLEEKIGVVFGDDDERKEFFEEFDRFMEIYKNDARINNQKPSDLIKMMKSSYDYQMKTYGETDQRKLYRSLLNKVKRANQKVTKKEDRETKALFDKPKTQKAKRTRPTRARAKRT